MRVNISLTSVQPARTVQRVVIDIRTHPAGATPTLWHSTIGKKAVMAVTGLIMVLFLLLHMLGNLKIFFGPRDFGPGNRASFATHTMRWGGVIIGLFIVWHLLDLTAGVTNPDFERGRPYHNVVVDFQVWWINLIYVVGVVMVGLHIHHGFWSATQTLGVNRSSRDVAIRAIGTTLAVTITAGFVAVPIGVMTGLVR
jgi:succinate dehydrogenase / fumarate reductase cytochrome b subunit